MANCEEISSEALKVAEEVIPNASEFYGGTIPACLKYTAFLNELRRVLVLDYNATAQLAKSIADPIEEIPAWECLIINCDKVAELISGIRETVPECGNPEDFDFVLDVRNAAKERADEFNQLFKGE